MLTLRQAIKSGARLRIQGQKPEQQAQRKFRVKARGEFDSKAEAAYADYLAILFAAKEITHYIHHPFKVKLADGAWYTPDFLVVHASGETQIVEVKGYQWSRDVVRWKVAADRFPFWRWTMVKREGRGWLTLREQRA